MGRPKKNVIFVETDLSIGSIFSRSFSTLAEQPFLYLALGLLSVLPMMALWLAAPGMSIYLVKQFIIMFSFSVISAASAVAVNQLMMGQAVGLGEALSRGLTSFGNLALLALLVNILIFIGFLLLILPGFAIACMCAVVIPACVIEGLTPTESTLRSFHLTQDFRLKIFAILLIYALGFGLISMAGQAAAEAVSRNQAIRTIIFSLFLVPPLALYGIVSALLYSDLKLIKEGMEIEKTAEDA